MDEQVDESALRALFIPFGEVREVTIPLDVGTGQRRGFGFVEFDEAEDAAEARDNMNSCLLLYISDFVDAEFYGKVINVSYSKQMKATLISSKPSSFLLFFLCIVWAQIDNYDELLGKEEDKVMHYSDY